jgi:hypothetical protein
MLVAGAGALAATLPARAGTTVISMPPPPVHTASPAVSSAAPSAADADEQASVTAAATVPGNYTQSPSMPTNPAAAAHPAGPQRSQLGVLALNRYRGARYSTNYWYSNSSYRNRYYGCGYPFGVGCINDFPGWGIGWGWPWVFHGTTFHGWVGCR